MRENNYPHHVKGGFKLPFGGDVDEFIEVSLNAMEKINNTLKLLYSEEGGVFTYKGVD